MDKNFSHIIYNAKGERVCSKIGGGFALAAITPSSTQNFLVNDETQVATELWDMVRRGIDCTGFPPENVETKKELRSAENLNDDAEINQYFYHSDHLGSSSFITDATGNATQHLQYLSFGETWIDQQSGSFDSRYKFSAKELDDETGYNFFGARYYDSDLSVWLSVDPLSDKYPNSSPYLYCENNPVVYVDPNGEFKRRFGAMIYKCFHGGEIVQAIAGDRKGEWYVNKTSVSRSGILYGTRKIPNSNPEVAAAYEGDATDVGSKMRYSWRDGKSANSSGESWWANRGDDARAVFSAIGDFIKRIDEGGHADGANAASAGEQAPVAIKVVANINPLVSIGNIFSWSTSSEGKNIYNEKASNIEKGANIMDLFTFGAASACSKPVLETMESIGMPIINATTTVIDEEMRKSEPANE